MKKSFLTLLVVLSIIKLKAAVILVNNSSNSPSNFSNIDTAMAAANPSDTIYISGSMYGYGNFTITKPITIIGTGVNPQKQLPYTSVVNDIGMSANLSNVSIKGLIISGSLTMAYGTQNFNLEYCFFSAGIVRLNSACTDNKISNCIFQAGGYNRNIDGFDPCGGYYSGCFNLLIQNCIFSGNVSGLNIPGTVIQNNIFLGSLAFNGTNIINNGGCYTTSYVINATIQNNIFYGADPNQYQSGCAFNNNITYHPSNTFAALSGTGNLDNVNPQFVNFPAGGGAFGWAYNFDLQATSPGNNAGTDGTDIGYLGGNFPSSTFGETYNMPVIRQMNITNTNVPQNGNVNVKLRSTKARSN